LPYKLVKASQAIDTWTLGVIAFLLLTGESFVSSTRDEDCTSGTAAGFVYSWGLHTDPVKDHLQKIEDPAGRDFHDKVTTCRISPEHIFINPKQGKSF